MERMRCGVCCVGNWRVVRCGRESSGEICSVKLCDMLNKVV